MTLNELLEQHQFIAGAIFAFIGGAISFTATSIKDYIYTNKTDKKEYENFKMQIFSELNEIHLELIDAVKERDAIYMEYIDNKSSVRRFIKNQDGSPNEHDLIKEKLDRHNKLVKTLKNKFVKQSGFYLYKKKYKSTVTEYQSQLLTIGLKYIPSQFTEWKSPTGKSGVTSKIEFQKIRLKEYNNFHITNVVFPLTNILRAVLDDK